ncbi:acyl carrier protein [Streptomyces sp. NRRL S-31]|uniref:acyl carrier protein n=1 Tax=Streptomyces sp. NRRL S-31 TaxID=1463898 RepID=UPI00055F9758|nr:acyl carrier protein [Streptomyces sp. NRRL S-31]
MTDPTVARIIAIICEHFDTGDTEVSAATDFESLEFDSLVLVELAVILTNEFGVEVTDEELANGRTVGESAAIVARKSAALAR